MENPNILKEKHYREKRGVQGSQDKNKGKRLRSRTQGKIGLAAASSCASFGAASLIGSVVYDSSILAFIGLGLVFWGAILLYVQPEEHARKVLLDAAVLSSLTALNKIMEELNYKGTAIYLPPEYFKDPEENRIYIPKLKEGGLPSAESILENESRFFVKNPEGILLTAPGAELTRLFEKTLGTSFNKVDLEYLQQNLPRLFIEDLEIAGDLEIERSRSTANIADPISSAPAIEGTIRVKITGSILKDICKENRSLSQIYSSIGCPISSAIACALARATGKPVIIQSIQTSEDGNIVEATYNFFR